MPTYWAETRRLIAQSRIYGPFTRRLLEEAGLRAGMRVLDVGTGAGDVALMAAELIGPRGSVVGVDHNPKVLKMAHARARAAGLTNVTFLEGTIDTATPDEDFDAVMGRLILMYQPDPAKMLRELTQRVRSGGIVAFQEFNLTRTAAVVAYPPTPLWKRVAGWLLAVAESAGVETEMGYKLFRTYLDAGLPVPKMEVYSPAGGGPDWQGYEYLAETLRSMMPFLLKFGIASEEEVDIDTLDERLRTETVASGAVVRPPELVSAWVLKP